MESQKQRTPVRNDVAVGREYVKAYVFFLHYLEHLGAEEAHN